MLIVCLVKGVANVFSNQRNGGQMEFVDFLHEIFFHNYLKIKHLRN